MKLKQILFTSIAALSLSGFLHGMEMEEIITVGDEVIFVSELQKITCANSSGFFDLIPNDDEVSIEKIKFIVKRNRFIVNVKNPNSPDQETALDFAIRQNRPDLLEIFLPYEFNANFNMIPIGNHLNTAITMDCDSFYLNKQVIHLLCSGGATMESSDDQLYHLDPNNALTIAEDYGNDDIIEIIQRYIHSRLAQAIINNNVNEVQRIITKYKIDINQNLPCYSFYTTTFISSKPVEILFIPLHTATASNQHDVTRFLINECGADVTIQDNLDQTALHHEPDLAIAQLLMEKGCNPNSADITGRTPIDNINYMLTADMLEECSHQPERIEKIRALKRLFENQADNIPVENPANNIPVIGNNVFSWKLIGGGAVVVVAAIAAKKLYNWWYKEAEVAQETTETDAHTENNEVQKEIAKDKTATQI